MAISFHSSHHFIYHRSESLFDPFDCVIPFRNLGCPREMATTIGDKYAKWTYVECRRMREQVEWGRRESKHEARTREKESKSVFFRCQRFGSMCVSHTKNLWRTHYESRKERERGRGMASERETQCPFDMYTMYFIANLCTVQVIVNSLSLSPSLSAYQLIDLLTNK